jgi:hypothetical protein
MDQILERLTQHRPPQEDLDVFGQQGASTSPSPPPEGGDRVNSDPQIPWTTSGLMRAIPESRFPHGFTTPQVRLPVQTDPRIPRTTPEPVRANRRHLFLVVSSPRKSETNTTDDVGRRDRATCLEIMGRRTWKTILEVPCALKTIACTAVPKHLRGTPRRYLTIRHPESSHSASILTLRHSLLVQFWMAVLWTKALNRWDI